MKDLEIDEAILAVSRNRDAKVAMIIAKAADALGGDFLSGGEHLQIIFRRIEALVANGKLIARGDIADWRHSEIRRVG